MSTLPPPQILEPSIEDRVDEQTHPNKVRAALAAHGATSSAVRVVIGPQAVRYLLAPDGVLPAKFERATDAVALATGRPTRYAGIYGDEVGFEVTREERDTVQLASLVYPGDRESLGFPVGRGIDGAPIRAKLNSLPHLLVAGTTGSGKSVFMNSLIAYLVMHNPPETLRLTMIDPKRVELAIYEGLPHLTRPVITDVAEAVDVLAEVVREMDERYSAFEAAGVKNIEDYNRKTDAPLASHVVIIDELADLMMTAGKQVEDHLVRLGQLARAAGIHLVLATQRPAATTITPKIKANIPGRAVFAVNSHTDSKVALDFVGAEKLSGRGDGLWKTPGRIGGPVRFQSPWVSDAELLRIVTWWKENWTPPEATEEAPIPVDTAAAEALAQQWRDERDRLDHYAALSAEDDPAADQVLITPPEAVLAGAGLSADVVRALVHLATEEVLAHLQEVLNARTEQ